MGATLKVRAVGNSMGVVLPRDILARLRIGEGDILHVIETADGVRLVPYDPEFARQMEAARKVMRRRRAALRELAK
jgi:putative addiction module antidote